MKKILLILSSSLLLLTVSCGHKNEVPVLSSERDTVSWAMGMSLAETVKSGFLDFDTQLVMQAFSYTLQEDTPDQPIDKETYDAACQFIAYVAAAKQRETAQKQSQQAAVTESEIFAKLAQEHPELKKHPDGYYYQVVKQGKGPKAKIGQRVKFDFSSTILSTGQEYLSSKGRESIVHTLGNPMFPGMQSGMQMMNAGSTYIFYFPSNQAFGAAGTDDLPPYTPLKYEIQLHEIYND